MKNLLIAASVLSLLASPAALAQPGGHGGPGWREQGYEQQGREWRDDHGRHRGWARDRGQDHRWRRGQRMGYNDWNRAERVDYRQYHLRQPPRGYEWRRQNDQFVLGAIATGVITSIILNAGR